MYMEVENSWYFHFHLRLVFENSVAPLGSVRAHLGPSDRSNTVEPHRWTQDSEQDCYLKNQAVDLIKVCFAGHLDSRHCCSKLADARRS
jgi:hypothetical protein